MNHLTGDPAAVPVPLVLLQAEGPLEHLANAEATLRAELDLGEVKDLDLALVMETVRWSRMEVSRRGRMDLAPLVDLVSVCIARGTGEVRTILESVLARVKKAIDTMSPGGLPT